MRFHSKSRVEGLIARVSSPSPSSKYRFQPDLVRISVSASKHVHSRGKMPLLFAMRFRSMYPTYFEAASFSFVFRSVFSKRGVVLVQYILVPIAPVLGPLLFGKGR